MLLPGLSVDAYYGFENFNMQYLSINTYAVFREENTDGTYTQFGKDEYKNGRSSAMMDGFYRYNTLGAGLNYNHTFTEVYDTAVRLFYNHSAKRFRAIIRLCHQDWPCAHNMASTNATTQK